MPESGFTHGGRMAGQENRQSKDDLLSPLSEQNVENLNPMIPPVDAAEESPGEPSHSDKRRQIDLILSSRSFRNAPLLQKFLEFITSESFHGRHEELSEYVIATQVFGRPEDFDPAADTIVRTQAYRLRTKLKEYYENEGKTEPVIIEVPKGRYIPAFSLRENPAAESIAQRVTDESVGDLGPATDKTPSLWYRRQAPVILVVAVLGIGLSLGAGVFLGRYWLPAQSVAVAKAANIPEPLDRFWSQFLGGDIILAYTNGVFLETETADLLRFRNSQAVADRGALVGQEAARAGALNPELVAHAGKLYYEESFTGTGEVLAAYRLASLFTQLGAKVQVKRSRLVTVDDLRNHDVIFLGSPFENEILADMHLSQRFSFVQPTQLPFLWHGRILDHKASAEDVSYPVERDPQSQVIRADYALFDVLPGPVPGRRIVVLAGITTSGTEGAAEFATSAEGLRQILALGGDTDKNGNKTFPRYFESLLRVEAEKGLEAIDVKFVDGSVVKVQK
ncbi:MAG: hypothetical protein WB799_19890 [Candidatus Sulfotelmatobacter sp.]